jgi:hypothetical protein
MELKLISKQEVMLIINLMNNKFSINIYSNVDPLSMSRIHQKKVHNLLLSTD